MGVTSGFFNSLNGDRKYNAEQMSSLFDGIINDGVFATIGTAMAVKAFEGTVVHVGIGRAWFNHTWINNDAIFPIEMEPAELLTNRYDAIVIEVDHTEAIRNGFISVIKGTPAETAAVPGVVKSPQRNQYPLCYIYRAAGSSEIKQTDITNLVGSNHCPYVTGLIQVVSIENVVAQWKAQWDEWFSSYTGDSVNDLTDFENQLKGEITEWFNNIQSMLDGDAAVNLANKILELSARTDGIVLQGGAPFDLEDANGTQLTDSNGNKLAAFIKIQLDSNFGSKFTLVFNFSDPDIVYENCNYTLRVGSLLRQGTFSRTNRIIEESAIQEAGIAEIEVQYDIVDGSSREHQIQVETVDASHYGVYNFTIDMEGGNFEYTAWLASTGNNVIGYNSLDDILADEKLVRELMTRHSSADYLAEKCKKVEDIQPIAANKNAVKWIGLRSYIYKKLMAIPEWKNALENSEHNTYIANAPEDNDSEWEFGTDDFFTIYDNGVSIIELTASGSISFKKNDDSLTFSAWSTYPTPDSSSGTLKTSESIDMTKYNTLYVLADTYQSNPNDIVGSRGCTISCSGLAVMSMAYDSTTNNFTTQSLSVKDVNQPVYITIGISTYQVSSRSCTIKQLYLKK